MNGKLYLIPTPIGNLEDITYRAVRILKEADTLLAEDTRHASRLLAHLGIDRKAHAHHQHNEHKTLNRVIRLLKEGQQVALVSDAGTPGISDPGFLLVRECIREGIDVETLPGPTAFVPALVNSGLPCERFCFEGFLPVKKGRQTRLGELAGEKRTMVFYEAPHRLLKAIDEFIAVFGPGRPASISRELTKVFEENVRGSLQEIKTYFENHALKGEFVICVAGNSYEER